MRPSTLLEHQLSDKGDLSVGFSASSKKTADSDSCEAIFTGLPFAIFWQFAPTFRWLCGKMDIDFLSLQNEKRTRISDILDILIKCDKHSRMVQWPVLFWTGRSKFNRYLLIISEDFVMRVKPRQVYGLIGKTSPVTYQAGQSRVVVPWVFLLCCAMPPCPKKDIQNSKGFPPFARDP